MDNQNTEEKKKMFDLIKDRELGGNMDWMYRGDKPDNEDFLLGKSVDKLVTEAVAASTEEGGGGGGGVSIISERIKANVALDMQAKMREDPLFAIRKKEEDAKRRLLENPVKMKQLEKLVERQRQQQKSKSTKKSKKEKKNKKKKKRKKKSKDSDSDSDSSESEDDLVDQYLSILTQKKQSGEANNSAKQDPPHHAGIRDARQNNNHRSPDGRRTNNFQNRRRMDNFPDRNRNDRSPERHRPDRNRGDEQHQRRPYDRPQMHGGGRHDDRDMGRSGKDGESHRKTERRSQSPPHKRGKGRSSSSESEGQSHKATQRQDSSDGEMSKRVYGLIKSVRHNRVPTEPPPQVKVKSKDIKKSRSSSSSDDSSRSRSRSSKPSIHRKETRRHDSSSPKRSKHNRKRSSSRSKSRSPVRRKALTPPKRRRSASPPRKPKSPPKKKLTAEEREKKVQEMMDNAKWRDEQRVQNVQRYRQDEEKESGHLSTYQGEAKFLSSMMSEHAANSSVEDRIKRNKHKLQRTRAALDKKFTQH